MGNNPGKNVSIDRCSGQSEASLEEGRFFEIHLPDDTKREQLIFPKQTAYTLKESILGQKYPYKANYDVVSALHSNARMILQDNMEFEAQFDAIEKIHIVPKGAMENQAPDNTSLIGAIKLKL